MKLRLLRLVYLNILGSRFRSSVIALCAALVAGLAVLAFLVLTGAQDSLQLNLQRLGADVIVMPWGVMIEETDSTARLMAFQSKRYMPRAVLKKIAAVRGVESVSPQLFLSTVKDPEQDVYPDYFLIAYDPETDFTLHPWNRSGEAEGLQFDEAVVGSEIMPPSGHLILFGREVRIARQLEPTGTDLDRSVFINYETAYSFNGQIHNDYTSLGAALNLAPDSASAAMVKVRPGSDPHEVAVRILNEVNGVIPIEATNFFQTERKQMIGLMQSLIGLLAMTLLLSTIFTSLIFSLAVNERSREIGVLMALGATRKFIYRSLLLEGVVLALVGGFTGMLLVFGLISGLHAQISQAVGIPIHVPQAVEWVGLWLAGLALSLVSVAVAVQFPASRITRQEIASVMRE